MYEGDPFTVEAGDITMTSMVIESIRRTKDASNENGLIFVATLREWLQIETSNTLPQGICKVSDENPTGSAISNFIQRGQQSIQDAGKAINDSVNGFFS